MRRSPIKAKSSQQRAKDERRRPVRDRYLRDHPNCEAGLPGCWTRTVQVHEPLTRARGGSIEDRDNMLALCGGPCHDWIHNHPALSLEKGWLRSACHGTGEID